MSDYMTTSEVSAYLRIKERTIYDLVSRQEIPCSRATGKLLFPRNLIDRWIEAHIEFQDPKLAMPPPIVGGSSDPLLEWAMRESGCGLASIVEGSSAGLTRMEHGGAVAAGVHFGDEEKGEEGGNIAAVRGATPLFDIVLVQWAWRKQGLVLPEGNPLGLEGIRDIAERGARIVGRQEGSGTQILLDRMLEEAGLTRADINLVPKVALTQSDVALAVIDGEADCGLAVGAVAQRFKLHFVGLHSERFDLACRRRELLEPPLQTLLAFARSEAFRQKAAAFGDYDIEECGKILFNR